MAAKQNRSGHIVYIEFNSQVIADGSTYGYYRSFDPQMAEVTVSSTAGADALENEHKIRETCMPTLEILIDDDTNGALVQAALEQGQTGNLIWGPEGNTSGDPRWGIEARVKKSNIAFSHDSEQVLSVEFAPTSGQWLYDGRSSTF